MHHASGRLASVLRSARIPLRATRTNRQFRSPAPTGLRAMTDEAKPISRRTFVRDGATAAAAFAMAPMIVPRHVLGGVGYRAPSRTLNVAMIGFGGMGMSNMNALLQAGENIVAVCDIDYGYVERSIAGRLRPRQGQPGAPPEGVKVQERTPRQRNTTTSARCSTSRRTSTPSSSP